MYECSKIFVYYASYLVPIENLGKEDSTLKSVTHMQKSVKTAMGFFVGERLCFVYMCMCMSVIVLVCWAGQTD